MLPLIISVIHIYVCPEIKTTSNRKVKALSSERINRSLTGDSQPSASKPRKLQILNNTDPSPRFTGLLSLLNHPKSNNLCILQIHPFFTEIRESKVIQPNSFAKLYSTVSLQVSVFFL